MEKRKRFSKLKLKNKRKRPLNISSRVSLNPVIGARRSRHKQIKSNIGSEHFNIESHRQLIPFTTKFDRRQRRRNRRRRRRGKRGPRYMLGNNSDLRTTRDLALEQLLLGPLNPGNGLQVDDPNTNVRRIERPGFARPPIAGLRQYIKPLRKQLSTLVTGAMNRIRQQQIAAHVPLDPNLPRHVQAAAPPPVGPGIAAAQPVPLDLAAPLQLGRRKRTATPADIYKKLTGNIVNRLLPYSPYKGLTQLILPDHPAIPSVPRLSHGTDRDSTIEQTMPPAVFRMSQILAGPSNPRDAAPAINVNAARARTEARAYKPGPKSFKDRQRQKRINDTIDAVATGGRDSDEEIAQPLKIEDVEGEGLQPRRAH